MRRPLPRLPYKPLSNAHEQYLYERERATPATPFRRPTNPPAKGSTEPAAKTSTPAKTPTPAKTLPKPAAKTLTKTPKPARSAPNRAAAPKRKPAKRRTKQAKQRVTVKSKLLAAALDCLRTKYPEKYSKGFAKAQPAVLISQMKPIWAEVCKAEGVSPEDHPLPKWDMVARAIGHRRD